MSSLRLRGCTQFRQRIVSAALSGKTLRVDDIRAEDDQPGLQDFEASFLRLIEKMTDGISIEINETGTTFKFKPGIIVGGKISHDCGTSRSVGWFIEGILPLAIFAKDSLQLELTGVTNDSLDLSVDILTNVTFPLLRNFGIEGIDLIIKRRGISPKGGGIVLLTCPIVRELLPIHVIDPGLVKRVRGLAFCSRITPAILTRVIDSARGVLNNLLPDVYINTNHFRGAGGGASAGYSLSLVAESTTGVLYSSERTALQGERPEDVGLEGAILLLEEIRKGGVIDSSHQSLVLQLMVMGPEDVCKVRFGNQLTDTAIETLRLLRDSFGVTFKIKKDTTTDTILLSCLGIGYKNINRKAC